jgi:hypothetical protein
VYANCLLHISQFELGWWVHEWDVTVKDTIGFSYWVYIAGLLYNSAIAPVKAAILLEWMRLFSSHSRSAFFWFCHGALWFNITYYVAAIIVESMRCTPRQMIWDPEIKGTCLNPNTATVLSSIALGSDVIMLILPQFVVWRLKLSTWQKFGVVLIFAFALFGTISAILRLVATQEYSESEDRTYYMSSVCFWALGEITSVFVVYGLPAVPTILVGAAAGFTPSCTRQTRASLVHQTGDEPKSAIGIGPWREGRTRLWKNYTNLDRNSLPANAIDTAMTRCTSTIIDPGPPGPPESVCVVVKTVEIRRDEIRTDASGDVDTDIGEDVMLRQHPWVKLG